MPVGEKRGDILLGRLIGDWTDAERLRNRRGDEGRVPHRGEGDEPDAVRKADHVLRDVLRQPRLADTARTGQGDEPHAVTTEQRPDRINLALPTDQRRQRDRQGRSEPVPIRDERRGQWLGGGGPVG